MITMITVSKKITTHVQKMGRTVITLMLLGPSTRLQSKEEGAKINERKKIKKSIIKSLGILNSTGKKMTLISYPDVDHHVSMVIKVLGEVSVLAISLFKTI